MYIYGHNYTSFDQLSQLGRVKLTPKDNDNWATYNYRFDTFPRRVRRVSNHLHAQMIINCLTTFTATIVYIWTTACAAMQQPLTSHQLAGKTYQACQKHWLPHIHLLIIAHILNAMS
jgi:hypothetical protein